MKTTTIQDQMVFMCATRFEMQEEQLELARAMEIPEEGEIASILTETQEIEEIEPISDTEEGEEELRQSVRAGKRRKSVLSNIEEDNDEEDDGLPVMQSQIRESGRVRKRPKALQDYEIRIN
jgi:hypothetical protein